MTTRKDFERRVLVDCHNGDVDGCTGLEAVPEF